MVPNEFTQIEKNLSDYEKNINTKSEEDNVAMIAACTLGLGAIFGWVNYAVRVGRGVDYPTRRKQAKELRSLLESNGGEGDYSDKSLVGVQHLCNELKSCRSKKLLAIAETFRDYLEHPQTKRCAL